MKFYKTLLATTLLLAGLAGCGQDTKVTETTNKEPLNNTPATSNDPNHQPDIAKTLQDNLNQAGIPAQVTAVMPTDMPELYWVTFSDAAPVFVDKTGKYVIQGTVVALENGSPMDISRKIKSATTVKELEAVDKSEMIIFPAKGATQAVVYVFSDPTCHYCQILHKEIDQTNAAGIEVRYLAWPRGEELIALSERVWCNSDRNTAITEAKRGKNISSAPCQNPVRKHMELGYKLGVTGTPAVFAENGVQLGGYLPTDRLVAQAIANKK